MKVPGYFYLVFGATVLFVWSAQDVKATSVLNTNTGLLTLSFIFATLAVPQSNFSLPQHEIAEKNVSEIQTKTRSSLRKRVVRQFGFLAPALQTMGCMPKLFCGLNAKEPTDDTSTLNDLSYLMKFAFTNELDEDIEQNKKGKDGNEKNEEQLTKVQEQMIEDLAHEELVYDDPQYLSYIWKDMMKSEKKDKNKMRNKKRRRQKSLELELDILLKTLEIDRNFNKFSNRFQKFRDIFQSHRQSRDMKLQDDPNFNSTEYIKSKIRQLTEISDEDKKLDVAVEAGGKLRNSRQCRLLFDTCPYTVDQLKEMVKVANNSRTPPKVKPPIYDDYPGRPLKHRPSPLHVSDPLQSYMTDDVYIENLDSEHHLEIQEEESDKIKKSQKKKPRPPPDISVTVGPTSTYDADSQLLYLMLPESEIALRQKIEEEMQAQAGHTKIKSTEDDEASDQIIPLIQVEYTKSEEKNKKQNEKSSEEIATSKEPGDEEESSEEKPVVKSKNKHKAPLISKEEHHDDELTAFKDEKVFMTTTKRPRSKYRIRNKNKNKDKESDYNDEESEQNDASEEQSDQNQPSKGKQKKGNTNSKITPMPPIFGIVKEKRTTTESSVDSSSSTSTSTQKTTMEEIEESESDEGPSILKNAFRRPYPIRGNKYPQHHAPVQYDDNEDSPKPQRIPLGPIATLGGNNHNNLNKYRPPPIPPPPPIYNKLPNSKGQRPPSRPQNQNKKPPSSILSSILNFKIVAPKKRPRPRPRPEQKPNSNRPQRPNKPNHEDKIVRKEPFLSSLNPIALLGLGGNKNRPIGNGKRPIPSPPPIYNGKRPQNSRPMNTNQPSNNQEFDTEPSSNYDGSSSEEAEVNEGDTEKSMESEKAQEPNKTEKPTNVFDLGPLAELGEEVVISPEHTSPDVPPPPVFGVVKPDALTESNKPNKAKINIPGSLEREESGSTEEDPNSDEDILQKSPPGSRLPMIGSNKPSHDLKNHHIPPPPPVYNKRKPPNGVHGKLPHSSNNNHGNSFPKRPLINQPKPQISPNGHKDSLEEDENSREGDDKSSEEIVPEDDEAEHREPPRKPLGALASIGGATDKSKINERIPPPPPLKPQWKPSGGKVNKNETSSEEGQQQQEKHDSEEQNDGDGSAEDTKVDESVEDKEKSSEDEKIEENQEKSEEGDENGKSEENTKNDKSEEQKSDEGSSEEITDNKKETENQSETPPKVPTFEIATLGETETSIKHSIPPPPPVQQWAPSSGILADDIEDIPVSVKPPVAYMQPGNLYPPRNPAKTPRPIMRSTPRPKEQEQGSPQAQQGRPPGEGSGEGGNPNKNNRNKNKNNQNKNKEKDTSEEKDGSDEDGSGEDDDDEGDDDSIEHSSEEVQDEVVLKNTNRNPGSRVVEKLNFPNIGNPIRNGEQVKRPAKLTIALPPLFKWRSRVEKRKGAENQRMDKNPNENENGYQSKVYKLSLSSEESSKSSSASIESISKSVSNRHEQREMVSDTTNTKDEDVGAEQSNHNNNNSHNSQSEEIDSRRLGYEGNRAGGESTIKISNKNRQFYSQPHSKKSLRGESRRRKAAPPLPPIYGKVGR